VEVLELSVGALLRETAARAPDTVALVAGERRWTYAELLAQSERAARALLGRFEEGERVAIWANNIPEWVLLELAAGLAGLTIVTVNPALRAQELAHVLGDSRADGIFFVPSYRGTDMAAMLEAIPLREKVSFADWDGFCASGSESRALPDVDPGSAAQIQYTSGTTGRPKGAVLHHRGLVNNARLSYARLGVSHGFVQLSPMPLFHTAGCAMSVLGSIAYAGTLILPPAFDPALMVRLIADERPEVMLGVPTMLMALTEAVTDASSLRYVITGGTVVPPALVRRVEAAFDARVSIVFAQTEASPVITQTSPDDDEEDRATTLGRPLEHTEVKIVDVATGEPVAPDVVGEVCTRGYHVMTGYFDNPEATAAAIDADGWLHTGEAVLGVPDEAWGEQVAAFIRPAPGRTPDPDALFAYCRERLAPHKAPRHWTIVDAFPLTPSGKVQKFVLRERFLADR
jgi:acyl-CoA synthetase (AMP-forming)/AMP-acid ligase II